MEITGSGGFRLTRAPKDGYLPKNSDEFRQKIRLWGYSWRFAALRSPNRAALQGIDLQIFSDYVDFMLGKEVGGLTSKDPAGTVVSRPAFSYVLAYDSEIRERTADLMNEGYSFVDAFSRAQKDPDLKGTAFNTPVLASSLQTAVADIKAAMMAHASSSRGASSSRDPPAHDEPAWKKKKGAKADKAEKGDKKGKGKGKGDKGDKGKRFQNTRTPDGRMICFAFNKQSGCRGSCGMVHCCTTCHRAKSVLKCRHTDADAGGVMPTDI
jgi:hypothetical protein